MDKWSNENHDFLSYYSNITAFRYSNTPIFQYFCLAVCIWLNSCAPPSPVSTPVLTTPIPPQITISDSELTVTVSFSVSMSADHIITVNETLKTVPYKYIENKINNRINDDSLAAAINTLIKNNIPSDISFYSFDSTMYSHNTISMVYTLNEELIDHIIAPFTQKYGHPENKIIYPLFSKEHSPPDLDAISELILFLPCENVPVPTQALLLPNAPRSYRSGTHRGIDFYVNWGTPVRAVADGTVIRADHHFEEVSPDFRQQLLEEAKQLGRTPSDVFEHVLVGRSVYIDHGFYLVPGYRAVSIYAHLSHINGEIKPGSTVTAGQTIGLSGNSGTEPGTQGTRKGAHLHWELILHDAGGEYYLVQGFNSDQLYKIFLSIFSDESIY